MAKLRFEALQKVQDRKVVRVEAPSEKISEYFGSNVFGMEQLKSRLSTEIFREIKLAVDRSKKISKAAANAVASAVKTWATEQGVTHYTHWFQPLTGATAEKHDTFFDAMREIEVFRGSALIQQEPDASSFPNGGMRSTFEARGYSAWDPTSPMFLLENTLCIPTVFVSYTGESLDYKAPLLKTNELITRAATYVSRYFDRNITRVFPTLGCEQEYFVVDRALYDARPDLVMGERTVFGHAPARGQQLDDHYFGAIPARVYQFMRDFEIECHKLAIPVSTRHNEVAPAQFEVAPLFEEMNVAVDHNVLLQDVMKRTAERHNLKVLFHEKPFAALNGSGKHNNWSLMSEEGLNLLQPSSSARENLMFLTFFVNVIKAVHTHADLLRASIASAGNDYRLGANEAPPAIMSVFIGTQLTAVLDELAQNGNIKIEKGDNMYMKLGIDKIPEIILDNTDRNRTSPFAFTGNKFELRAVGSNSNAAGPMTALNLMVANQLHDFAKEVDGQIAKKKDKRLAIIDILRRYVQESKDIRFEGDGYSAEWEAEAKRRNLSNLKSTPSALNAYVSEKSVALYAKHNICTKRELFARRKILLENYIRKIQIESRVMGDLALNHVIPTAITYQNKLIANANGLKSLDLDYTAVLQAIKEITKHIESVKIGVTQMIDERRRINKIEDSHTRAVAYCEDVKEKYFQKIRYAVDKLELFVDSEAWPLPKYRELLFLK